MKKVTVLCAALVLMAVPAAADFIVINEAFVSHTGTDTYEYIELCGTPGMSLSDLSIITIEGDYATTGAQGLVDRRWNLTGVMPADGFYVLGCNAVPNNDFPIGVSDYFENGTETVLLVRNCTVVAGTDVDVDNNCQAETSVGTIVDGLCIPDNGINATTNPDCCYFGVFSMPLDGTNKMAGGARCADCIGGFRGMCFYINTCDVNLFSNVSAGVANNCPVTGTEETSWGSVKTLFR